MQFRAGGLEGWVAGDGPPVLLLHGGPGLSYEYLDDLAAELGDGYRIAAFQQRGLEPSTTDGPFDIPTAVADVVAVLDELSWERAWIVGHSWGGHLLGHVLVSAGERALGGLAVDPLGATGDGGSAEFEQAILDRTPAAVRKRAEELDQRAMRGEGTPEDVLEGLRLVWPAYYASPDDVPPMPPVRSSVEAYSGLWEAATAALPELEAALPGIAVPFGVVAGGASPMPPAASTAAAVPGGWIDVVEGAGHFVWYERPGSVRAGLERLIGD